MTMDRIEIIEADITKLNLDAIVNAANTSLLGGGGVDGAIHKAADKDLLEECKSLNGCKTGSAKITKGYMLPAKFIIHTVGPVWYGGQRNEAALLASCYQSSLNLAIENGIRTIAFPAISCGVYRFPIPQACRISLNEVSNFLSEHVSIGKVIFACFDKAVYKQLEERENG